jgi:hypothetical protein
MTEFIIGGAIGFVAGGALIWFGKDTIQKWVIGANALSKKLRAKADAIAKASKND